MSFNTLEDGLVCPFCQNTVVSGVGFRLGKIASLRYKVGDSLFWDGDYCRPESKPKADSIKTIGYYNCDYIKCSTWQDCYPDVQLAVITVENNVITKVEPYLGETPTSEFSIIEPADLVHL